MADFESFYQLHEGDLVMEDTYAEVYEIFFKDGEPWLRQVGWMPGCGRSVPDNERPADFDPNCTYDQHWYYAPHNYEVE